MITPSPTPSAIEEDSEQEKSALAKQIGKRIEFARKQVGRELRESRYGREKFAAFLGVAEATLKNYELGLMPPSVQFLYRLYLHTGFTPTWVCLGLEPQRDPEPKPILESSAPSPAPSPVRLTRFRASDTPAHYPPIDRKQAARVAAQILLDFADNS